MDKLILYSTHCPKCKILEAKLNQKKLSFEIVEDTDVMMGMGIMSVPILKVNDEMLDFGNAIKWVNGR